jgi:hypothetical protein
VPRLRPAEPLNPAILTKWRTWTTPRGTGFTLTHADRLDALYAHRHQLLHELIKHIVDADFEPSLELFTDALAILKTITRFWSTIEKDIGNFEDFGDVDLDEVVPLSIMIFNSASTPMRPGMET